MSKDNEFDRYEEIANYAEGSLDQEALNKFEAEMKTDAILAEEVDIYKHIPMIFEEEEDNDNEEDIQNLRETLNKIHLGKNPQGAKNKWFYIAIIVAVIAALIFVVQKFISPNSAAGPEKIYAQYAQHETLNLTSKGSDNDNIASNLEKAFNQKDYQTTLELSQTYLQNNSTAYDVLLAKAIAEIELQQYNAALSTLDQLDNSDVRIDKSAWYRALTYLKMKNIDEAKKELQQIIADKSFNHLQAQKLLKELE